MRVIRLRMPSVFSGLKCPACLKMNMTFSRFLNRCIPQSFFRNFSVQILGLRPANMRILSAKYFNEVEISIFVSLKKGIL